ncbi:biotin-dependent carboxyltransferase family protein [Paucibacter sp. PLA-PC-4]|uniref:5-oxoprolinase subunit C family protein n=1 Tax=Paucibacter sp. PLA-PC-4 TaxID=2993655 RepID=UPI002B053E15|nr:biotin-dependent carboxyltransferase family protein [Paucibacter sp. PLA-PC-4]
MSIDIEVIKPGAQSQLQDLGRYGYQHLGVPVCGAMDEYSHRLANLLVGNHMDQATLEIVLMGPCLRFVAATQIAICGADLSATLDGEPMALNRRLDVPAGAVLAFGRRINGLRSYLAVRGGFSVATLMGSRSTFVRGGFGGHLGRALRKGDWLQAADFQPAGALPDLPVVSTLPSAEITPLRVVLGEHWAGFTAEAQALFAENSYRISPQSDRMGYRLEGPALARSQPGELISEAVNFGSIQVPPDGQPIVLMAERQSTGGYPKIGHVISVDLPLLAQLAPQQALRFVPVSLETAQTLYLQREQQFSDALGAA